MVHRGIVYFRFHVLHNEGNLSNTGWHTAWEQERTLVKDKAKHKKKSYCVGADRDTVYEQTNYQTMFVFLCEMSCSFLKLVLAVNNAHTDTVPQTHTRLGTFNPLIVGTK